MMMYYTLYESEKSLRLSVYISSQNTQSGTQWDGLRHFGIFSQKVFYQGQVFFMFKVMFK